MKKEKLIKINGELDNISITNNKTNKIIKQLNNLKSTHKLSTLLIKTILI